MHNHAFLIPLYYLDNSNRPKGHAFRVAFFVARIELAPVLTELEGCLRPAL